MSAYQEAIASPDIRVTRLGLQLIWTRLCQVLEETA
jgi:hypothetical protein